ncbi:MAG: glycogen synthase GlgA [Gemmataceae bacterium]
MNILLAASEVNGFAKTGGLADVVGALPRALAARGHRCAIIMPLYRSVRAGGHPLEPTTTTVRLPIGTKTIEGRFWRSLLPGSSIPVYLVEQPHYFERDDSSAGYGLYQYTLSNGQKRDYSDNCARFVFFSRAVLEAIRLLDFKPDILHVNDWQTALVPVYLQEEYRRLPGFAGLRSVLTIHNLAYQGLFWHWDMQLTGLDWRLFNYRQLEFYGQLNFLKGGLVFADALTTVSPTYAREIQTPYYGCGLHGVLLERHAKLTGIVNGVDYNEWNPAIDPHLASKYDVDSLETGKPKCKQFLQRSSNLPDAPRIPLLGMVARLVEQKGIDLVIAAADAFLQRGAQLVILGEGPRAVYEELLAIRQRYPKQVAVTLGFNESLAHQIEAGADMYLMPSQYEPSGLNQLYSLRYGTVPIVRATGGLADTVTNTTPETLAAGAATGFSFQAYSANGLAETVGRALDIYFEQPNLWRQLMQTGMRQDWSWQRSAAEYERIFVAAIQQSIVPIQTNESRHFLQARQL